MQRRPPPSSDTVLQSGGSRPRCPRRGRALRISGPTSVAPVCLPAKASKPSFAAVTFVSAAFKTPSPVFMPLLYRRAASPSNRPKTSPCWSLKERAGTPQTVFSIEVDIRSSVERGIPSIVIVSRTLRFQVRDLGLNGAKKPSRPIRIAPLIASLKPGQRIGREAWQRWEAWEWENNHPVMMSHCPTVESRTGAPA